LWANKNGIQDAYFKYWEVLAEKFKDNPFILGYDIFNDPFAANVYKDSMMILDQTKFDREVL
jgi:endoglycosylceramidase